MNDTKHAIFCNFCGELRKNETLRNYQHFFILPNIFPYTSNHIMLLPVRHIHSELELTLPEQLELNSIHRNIVNNYYKEFGSCFYFSRENTPKQSMWHLHRHYLPNDNFIPDFDRVEYAGLSLPLVTRLGDYVI